MAGNVTQETNVVIKGKDDFTPAVNAAIGSLDQLTKKADAANAKIQGKFAKFGAGLQAGLSKAIVRGGQVLGASAVAGAVLSVKAFADYETALVGVGKTSGLEGKELDALGIRFKAIAERVPVSTKALLGIAQTAASLGVEGSENLERFSLTIAKLQTASDIVGEEGASQLARILNQTGEGGKAIGKNMETFASVLVALGNKMPATEAQIASMANELARTFGRFGGGSTAAAGLAGALASLGARAEESGGVINQVFSALDKHTRAGAKGLKHLSEITGIQADKLREAFGKDATGVFMKFVKGLSTSKNVNADLQKLGLSGIRVTGIMGTLASKFGILEDSMKMANDEAARGGAALDEEATKAFATTASKMEIFKNKLENLAINIGAELAPGFVQTLDRLIPLITYAAHEIGIIIKTLSDPNLGKKLSDAFSFLGDKIVNPVGPRVKKEDNVVVETMSDGVRGITNKMRGVFGLDKLAERKTEAFPGRQLDNVIPIRKDLAAPDLARPDITATFDDARNNLSQSGFNQAPDQKIVIEVKGDKNNIQKIDSSKAPNTTVNFNAGFQ